MQPDRAQRVYMLLAPTQESQAQWLEVLQAIEAKGSSSGSPQETIAIADSGQIR